MSRSCRRSLLALAAVPLVAGLTARGAEKPAASPPPDALAVVGPRTIRASELEPAIGGRLFELRTQEYELKRHALDDLVAQALLEQEASARRTSVAELLKSEVDAKLRPVTEDDKQAAYERLKGRLQGRSEAEAMATLEAGLRGERARERRAAFVRELKARSPVRVLLEPPRLLAVNAEGPQRGPKDAPVTIVEFSDFQCPYCGQATSTLRQVFEQYGGKVRLVYRDFPLPIHPQAAKAAEAAACASEQGKFWEMHDRLFANQQRLQPADLKRHAAELGLDAQRFDECLDSSRRAADWHRNVADGQRYGVSATPAFFVNGRLLLGAQPFETFAQVIDEELQRARPGR